ncbi:hypothetical protein ACFFX0_23425 [Citricoccus parietis]|uniref:Uncharacterized protein n=1 Tax=Citricoccus parietis TaxID=592307 RepID=A0ABV5G4W3_9MICC
MHFCESAGLIGSKRIEALPLVNAANRPCKQGVTGSNPVGGSTAVLRPPRWIA